ncbi:tyrosine-type recombinase/integrase [Kitasatospora sp. NPDC058397]|uniref:tyrosine-type recombinase/integrase n=1 Tax=unclassified Kitasatospora TaxID=2633591 RepID=UPI003652BD72
MHAVLRNTLEHAVREELINKNVAKLVKVPAPDYRIGKGLTTDQAKLVLKELSGHRLHTLYVLALMLGMRRGELLGLRWSSVDLERGTLTVSTNLQRVDGELRFVLPKTLSSERTLPLPAPVLAALVDHRERQAVERAAAGMDWQENDLVFPSRIGTPYEPDNLRRSWHAVRGRLGLDDLRFHDLRHTCITLLLDLGVPPHIVREIAGHSDVGVTMKVYAHASLAERLKALSRLGEALSSRRDLAQQSVRCSARPTGSRRAPNGGLRDQDVHSAGKLDRLDDQIGALATAPAVGSAPGIAETDTASLNAR